MHLTLRPIQQQLVLDHPSSFLKDSEPVFKYSDPFLKDSGFTSYKAIEEEFGLGGNNFNFGAMRPPKILSSFNDIVGGEDFGSSFGSRFPPFPSSQTPR
jgi:hypothetical protein